jgi:hypothetical protein
MYLFKNTVGCNFVNIDNVKDCTNQEKQEEAAE